MGNVRDPKVAERILADGDADLIGMGRDLIADPAWVNKVPQVMSVTSANVSPVTLAVPETVSV